MASRIARLLGALLRTGSETSRTAAPHEELPTPPEAKRPSEQQKRDYMNDPAAAATCSHLQPIEREMRAQGIRMELTAQIVVKASCRVYYPKLLERYAPLDPISYREYYIAERSPEDIPVAHLECNQCRSRIDTLHTVESNLDTHWFPAAPPSLTLVSEHRVPENREVTALTCSPSGRYLAIAAGNHHAPQYCAIWDVAEARPLVQLPAHGVIRSLAWSADERTLVTGRGVLWNRGPGSPGASIFVWDTATGAERLHFGPELFGVRGIALSPDGRLILASGMLGQTPEKGSTLDLWDVASGTLAVRLALVQPVRGASMIPVFEGVAFSPDGTLAYAACRFDSLPPGRINPSVQLPAWWNRGIRIWNVRSAREEPLLPHYTSVQHIAMSSDGRRLFYAGARLGIWDLPAGGLCWDQPFFENTAAVSPEFHLVASGRGYQVDNHGPYADTGIELFEDAKLVAIGLHHAPVEAISISAAGLLVAGGEKGELRFWRWNPESAG